MEDTDNARAVRRGDVGTLPRSRLSHRLWKTPCTAGARARTCNPGGVPGTRVTHRACARGHQQAHRDGGTCVLYDSTLLETVQTSEQGSG